MGRGKCQRSMIANLSILNNEVDEEGVMAKSSASTSMSLSSSHSSNDASEMNETSYLGLDNGTRVVYCWGKNNNNYFRAVIKDSRESVGGQAEYEIWSVGQACYKTLWIPQDEVTNVLLDDEFWKDEEKMVDKFTDVIDNVATLITEKLFLMQEKFERINVRLKEDNTRLTEDNTRLNDENTEKEQERLVATKKLITWRQKVQG